MPSSFFWRASKIVDNVEPIQVTIPNPTENPVSVSSSISFQFDSPFLMLNLNGIYAQNPLKGRTASMSFSTFLLSLIRHFQDPGFSPDIRTYFSPSLRKLRCCTYGLFEGDVP